MFQERLGTLSVLLTRSVKGTPAITRSAPVRSRVSRTGSVVLTFTVTFAFKSVSR